jgi:hypothetical protein
LRHEEDCSCTLILYEISIGFMLEILLKYFQLVATRGSL